MLRYFISFYIFLQSAVRADSPKPWQMGFQKAASPAMVGIEAMHHWLLIIVTIVAIIVAGLLAFVVFRFRAKKNPIPSKTAHHTLLEVVWTLVPVIILIAIGIPSLKLLFRFDKPQNPELTIKVVGHQWYWTYEYPSNDPKKSFQFDSTMIADKDLKPGQLRLLDVDEPVVVPINTTVRVLVTSTDVLHSFAVPALGIKRDAVPGRINETWFRIAQPGVYYGQCSELCGQNHGFMPIAIRVVSSEQYQEWLKTKGKT